MDFYPPFFFLIFCLLASERLSCAWRNPWPNESWWKTGPVSHCRCWSQILTFCATDSRASDLGLLEAPCLDLKPRKEKNYSGGGWWQQQWQLWCQCAGQQVLGFLLLHALGCATAVWPPLLPVVFWVYLSNSGKFSETLNRLSQLKSVKLSFCCLQPAQSGFSEPSLPILHPHCGVYLVCSQICRDKSTSWHYFQYWFPKSDTLSF